MNCVCPLAANFKSSPISAIILLAAAASSWALDEVFMGNFAVTSHKVQGPLYYNEATNTLRIVRLYYDGEGPGPIQFRVTTDPSQSYEDAMPLPILEADDKIELERPIFNEDITLSLGNVSVNQVRKVVIWCKLYGVPFGRVDLAEQSKPPREPLIEIGAFLQTEHGVSGVVHVVDNETLLIRDFSYDAQVIVVKCNYAKYARSCKTPFRVARAPLHTSLGVTRKIWAPASTSATRTAPRTAF